jgi:hydrogenase expression/formation protein HypC
MCLAVPGRILEIRDEHGTAMATVDFDGIHKEVCLAYLPDAVVGDYAIVHVGFALAMIDEASALETLRELQELGTLEENLGGEPASSEPVPPRSSEPQTVGTGRPA